MRAYYDLHLHSCLSPCGDMEMTPYNLVNMASLLGLDVIALTDHNSAQNCPAAIKAAKQAGIVCIPGMELNTCEEAHIVCLFKTLEGALAFDRMIAGHLPFFPNNPAIFGEQVVMDAEDHIINRLDTLLINATDISVMDIAGLAKEYGGLAFPAHIDKPAYSILASLGDIPPECGFTAAEVTASGDAEKLKTDHTVLQGIPLLKNSDAHFLENMIEPGAWLQIDEISADAVIDALSNGNCPFGRSKDS